MDAQKLMGWRTEGFVLFFNCKVSLNAYSSKWKNIHFTHSSKSPSTFRMQPANMDFSDSQSSPLCRDPAQGLRGTSVPPKLSATANVNQKV